MFQIRQQQMDAFSDQGRRDFENRVKEHLLKSCPEQVAFLSEEELRTAIRLGMQKATSYQIVRASCVASFIQILFEEGQDFDVNAPSPWVGEILTDQKLDDVAKIDYLWAYLDGYEKEDMEGELKEGDDEDVTADEAEEAPEQPNQNDLADEDDKPDGEDVIDMDDLV